MSDTATVLALPAVTTAIKKLIAFAMRENGIGQTHATRVSGSMADRLFGGEPIAPAIALVDAIVANADPRINGVTWIVIRDGRVAMERCAKKAKVLGVGEWFIPGGKLDDGETADDALVREIGEEWPSVAIDAAVPLPIVEGSAVPPGPKGIFLMRPYLVNIAGDLPATCAEGTPLAWVPVDEALRSPVPQVRMMVAAALYAFVECPACSRAGGAGLPVHHALPLCRENDGAGEAGGLLNV
jgi:8-oxo-dGTP pyrophosphatase MutT (NUDIX family)